MTMTDLHRIMVEILQRHYDFSGKRTAQKDFALSNFIQIAPLLDNDHLIEAYTQAVFFLSQPVS